MEVGTIRNIGQKVFSVARSPPSCRPHRKPPRMDGPSSTLSQHSSYYPHPNTKSQVCTPPRLPPFGARQLQDWPCPSAKTVLDLSDSEGTTPTVANTPCTGRKKCPLDGSCMSNRDIECEFLYRVICPVSGIWSGRYQKTGGAPKFR